MAVTQVNSDGLRFSHENEGYSEQARKVLAQPGGVAWTIFDEAGHQLGMQMHAHRDAEAVGAIGTAGNVEELASQTGCPPDNLARTVMNVEDMAMGKIADPFRPRFYWPTAAIAALPICQGHRCAVSHSGRA